MTTRIRRRAARLVDAIAGLLIVLAVARLIYVIVTPLSLESLTVGPALAVAAAVYIAATVLIITGFGALLMLCTVFRRCSVRWRAAVAYLVGLVLFAGVSIATEMWINSHRYGNAVERTP